MRVAHGSCRHTDDAHTPAIGERSRRRCVAFDNEGREIPMEHGAARVLEPNGEHRNGSFVRHRHRQR